MPGISREGMGIMQNKSKKIWQNRAQWDHSKVAADPEIEEKREEEKKEEEKRKTEGKWKTEEGHPLEDNRNILRIHTAEKKFPVSKNLYGIFFEDINRAGDGGLYPEMIRNRSFEDSIPPASSKLDEQRYALTSPQGWKDQFNNGEGLTRWILSNHLQKTEMPAWYAQEGTIGLDRTDTLNRNREASLAVSGPAGEAVLCNTGFAGMAFEAGRRYHCYLFLKADSPLQLTVALSDADGTLADDTLSIPAGGEDYVRIDTSLTAARNSRAEVPDPAKAYHGPMSDVGIQNPAEQTGMLKLTLRAAQGPVSARIGFTSLTPEETYLGHGLRKDIVEKLADLHPRFMRFPGGCIVEGFSPVWERPSHQLLWHYRTTNGLGFHEFLQLCEDLAMEPMYVFNCGMTCQGRKPVYFTGKEFDDILQDTMDALEYALGGPETKWGSLRARMGHPAPFRMTYLEIGNENSGPEYLSRYRICYDTIHACREGRTSLRHCG